MANWKSFSALVAELLTLVKVVHFMGGMYIWEFLISLRFEYDVLTGKRKFRPSFLIYLGARLFPIVTLITCFVWQDANFRPHCQILASFAFVSSYVGGLFASALIILRIVAIWERNKIVIVITSVSWLANVGACIRCAATLRASWDETIQSCRVLDVVGTRYNVVFIFISDFVLLALMLTGLLRWDNRRKGGIWHLLFTQGLAWVAAFMLAEIPPLVLNFMNLNYAMDLIFQYPGLTIISIGSTRIYRGLSDHLVQTTAIIHSNKVGQTCPSAIGSFRARPVSTSDNLTTRPGDTQGVIDLIVHSARDRSDNVQKQVAVDGDEKV
ncbi:hypothetical protein F5148DRAFT_1271041 [Russula earlei]|uniref:Uncharacterized protein n=1 Tax=Russula earlei TaxID=71964 RepID=A0ACC0TQM2_9AGAM|nr:hypothetical protein F5148DRAFT_1271041 [Russula earlei]